MWLLTWILLLYLAELCYEIDFYPGTGEPGGLPSMQMVTAAMKLKDAYSLEGKL